MFQVNIESLPFLFLCSATLFVVPVSPVRCDHRHNIFLVLTQYSLTTFNVDNIILVYKKIVLTGEEKCRTDQGRERNLFQADHHIPHHTPARDTAAPEAMEADIPAPEEAAAEAC